jgi:formamidopyrimidine-DNA glycosylase
MPELPEVEVTRLGIAPHLEGRTIDDTVVRHHGMRWPVPATLPAILKGLTVKSVGRRGKYLLLECVPKALPTGAIRKVMAKPADASGAGWLILHLGMSGSLRIVGPGTVPSKHEHFDLTTGEKTLRLNDPRRFGAILWHPVSNGPPTGHPLLAGLGVEPLTPGLTAELLYRATRGRKSSIKQALLAGDIVVGVGNIYASETLFRAGIRPTTQAGRVGLPRFEKLVPEIRAVLGEAIAKGGSTLRDFHSNGQTGYFQLDYFVYDRAGEPCRVCKTAIRRVVQGQRSSFYCPSCQR